jgi:hypothetical protein
MRKCRADNGEDALEFVHRRFLTMKSMKLHEIIFFSEVTVSRQAA